MEGVSVYRGVGQQVTTYYCQFRCIFAIGLAKLQGGLPRNCELQSLPTKKALCLHTILPSTFVSNLLHGKHIFWYHHNKQWMFHGTFNCYPLYDIYRKCAMFVPVSICLIACCYTMNQGSPFREPPSPDNGRQTMWGKCVNSKSEWNNVYLFETFRQLFMKRSYVSFFILLEKQRQQQFFNQESPFREPSLPTTVDKQCEASL